MRKSKFILQCFMDCASKVASKEFPPRQKSRSFSCMFSSRNFMAVDCLFSSVVHFMLIFVYDMKYKVKFIFCMWISSSSRTIYWSFHGDYCSAYTKNQSSLHVWIYLWTIYSVSLIYSSVLTSIPDCLDSCGFMMS